MASGPSLTEAQAERVGAAWVAGKCRAIAINTTYRRAPWADLLYACDGTWWRHHPEAAAFFGPKVTQDHGSEARIGEQRELAERLGLLMLRTEVNEKGQSIATGISTVPGTIRTGSNSGYQAINLAVQLGAKRILLLGFDMKKGPGGAEHWHGRHPEGCINSSPYPEFIKKFATAVPDLQRLGVEVINCTPGSALECFPRANLEAVL